MTMKNTICCLFVCLFFRRTAGEKDGRRVRSQVFREYNSRRDIPAAATMQKIKIVGRLDFVGGVERSAAVSLLWQVGSDR